MEVAIMAMSKRNKMIMYGVIFLLFIGIATVGMTSCMIKEREAKDQHAEAAYQGIKKDYDAGAVEDVQEKIDELKIKQLKKRLLSLNIKSYQVASINQKVIY
jgi:hypothetical protein